MARPRNPRTTQTPHQNRNQNSSPISSESRTKKLGLNITQKFHILEVVRSPGFEPGLSAWEAGVLTKLDYDRSCLETFQVKPILQRFVSRPLFLSLVPRSISGVLFRSSCVSVCSGILRSLLQLFCRIFYIEPLA